MISQIHLQNFAAFKELQLDFSPKINVIIGENSCGKTQILKSIYALTSNTLERAENLFGLFRPHNATLGSLYHRASTNNALLSIMDANGDVSKNCFTSKSRTRFGESSAKANCKCLLIPTKEILSLIPAIQSGMIDDERLSALFDTSITDLCRQGLEAPTEDTNKLLSEDPRAAIIARLLAKAVGGKYVIEGSEQYFVAGTYKEKKPVGSFDSKQAKMYSDHTELKFEKRTGTETSVAMTAEGYRKVGLLQRLLDNGTLTQSGNSTILWDEPESNMNPSLIRMLVECLLTLSRNGQQVILATHNYVLLKWLDLLVESNQGDHIIYHALYRDNNGNISSESNDSYKMLSANAISDTYSELYDAEISRSLG